MTRVLVQKNIRRAIRLAAEDTDGDDGKLQPGHMRLYSYYTPALKAGLYAIEAKQFVTCGQQSLSIWNHKGTVVDPGASAAEQQYFNVAAPQFNIDPKLIDTFYPPSGHSDEGRILPHIVFSDPHAPWFRAAGVSDWLENPLDADPGPFIPPSVPPTPTRPQTTAPSKALNTQGPPSRTGSLRSMVPWLALVVFDTGDPPLPVNQPSSNKALDSTTVPKTGDLYVSPDNAVALGLVASDKTTNIIPSYNPQKLPPDGAYQMAIGDYLGGKIKSRVYYEAGYTAAAASTDWGNLKTSTEMTSIIFPTKAQVQQIFGLHQEKTDLNQKDGSSVTPPRNTVKDSDGNGQKIPAKLLEKFKLLAHVRQVNTTGFPDAGIAEEGFYSVVISCRTGAVRNSSPMTQVVHLVSLEHLDSTFLDPKSNFPNLKDTDRIGLVSLYSWMYTCIAAPVNFLDQMTDLANDIQPLQPPQKLLDALYVSSQNQAKSPNTADKIKSQAGKILHDRLVKSYTLCRWRTASGEQTAAFNRGPLVACPTPTVPAKDGSSWPAFSMTGKDYQIFDRDIGLIDLTYSTAWSLGKLAAIADSTFNAALLRFRSLVWQIATSNTNMHTNGVATTAEVIAQATRGMEAMRKKELSTFSGTVSRINPASKSPVAPPPTHPDFAAIFSTAIQQAVDSLVYAGPINVANVYSDYSWGQAANSDWELIHGWISDCLYLKGIPAHYLFPEPTHINGPQDPTALPNLPNVPPEALRFFYIDNSWIDAFIDGALSCANHLEPKKDYTRLRIKEIYNYYLATPINGLEKQPPPCPRYGFILRSSVVKAYPDLKITVVCWKLNIAGNLVPDDGSDNPKKLRHDPVVQLTRMDQFTTLCLLDCLPEEICQIKMSQPPHQQRFAFGESLAPQGNLSTGTIQPEIKLKMLYTDNNAAEALGDGAMWPPLSNSPSPADQLHYWNPDSRVINPIFMAKSIKDSLLNSKENQQGVFNDQVPNSCTLGIELNDYSYSLIIPPSFLTQQQTNTAFVPYIRQLWTGPNSTPENFSPQAKLTDKFPPRDHNSQAPKGPQATISLPSATISPSSKLPPHPAAPVLHAKRAVKKPLPAAKTAAAHPSVVSRSLASQPASTAGAPFPTNAQFTVVLHPVYRPPAPTPIIDTSGEIIYAPMDFLPIDYSTLYDLVFAIRRITPKVSTSFRLAELNVEVPISDGLPTGGSDAPDPVTKQIREPLLAGPAYTGPGVRMMQNHRFVPILYRNKDSSGKPILGIRLIPRSSRKDATIPVTNDGRTDEASVCLAQPRFATIKDPNRGVKVAPTDANGKAPKTPQPPLFERCGVVKIRLEEVYVIDDKGTQRSFVTDGELHMGEDNRLRIPLQARKVALNGEPSDL